MNMIFCLQKGGSQEHTSLITIILGCDDTASSNTYKVVCVLSTSDTADSVEYVWPIQYTIS